MRLALALGALVSWSPVKAHLDALFTIAKISEAAEVPFGRWLDKYTEGHTLPILVVRGALEMHTELSGPDSRGKTLRKREPCQPSGQAGICPVWIQNFIHPPPQGCLSPGVKSN
ncbi:unnamed protein product [Rangifer tarandus platyrhynchus]|uniref:Uncharacterized protein n=1 Tax=Rangifer tarandus platyrhynchus TaxID=3082113 RepID=A0ABN8YUG9_RANTA|nr:unnamed protein product [Rangifer tarandus platyrhynchus]